MLYPIYVHVGDANHAHSIIFPDFSGCFSAADSWEELPAMAQEAAEAHFGTGDEPVPEPSQIDALVNNPEYQGGVWMMVDIDRAKINSKPVRVNISLPESLLNDIDKYAASQHMTRSRFLAHAAMKEMAQH